MKVSQVEAAAREAICGRCNKRVQGAGVVVLQDRSVTVAYECHGMRALVVVDLDADGPPDDFWNPFGRPANKPYPPVVFRAGKVSAEARRERRLTGRR